MPFAFATRRCLLDRRSSVTFSPLDLAPSYWFDAKSITPVADDTTLAQWDDLSTNGNHATQGIVGAQPRYRNSVLGKPAVRFDGVADLLTLPSLLTIGPQSLFASVVYNGVPNSYQPIVTLQKMYMLASLPAGSWGSYMGANVSSGVTLSGATRYVLSMVVRAPNDVDLVTNGSLVNVTTGSAYNSKSGAAIGNSPDDSFYCAMDLAELVSIPSAVSVSDRQSIETYMTARW